MYREFLNYHSICVCILRCIKLIFILCLHVCMHVYSVYAYKYSNMHNTVMSAEKQFIASFFVDGHLMW